ncbi:MAG TPA: trigger factor [Acholeplasmatales bacterium]|nr:trigger factor [Acholeplasmatales bacterium]
MNVNAEKQTGDKVLITVELSKEEFNVYYEQELTKLLANAEIKGFRKGKAPRKMFLDKFGEGQIYQNALDSALGKTYYEAITEQNIQVIDEPKIDIDFEVLDKEKTLKYKAEVLVYPEVELGQYFGVEVVKEPTEVKDTEIEIAIRRDLQSKSDLELVENGTLEIGNTAVFDFEGSVDGVLFDGGKAENYSLEIGSKQFIPGFEEQMVGMKSDEERILKVTFPADYQAENLKGKTADFKVKLHEIKKNVLPELNDEFVKSLEIEPKTVEEYKATVAKKLAEEKKEASDHKFEYDLLRKVCDNAKANIADVLVEHRKDNMLKQEEDRAKGYGITFEQLLKYQGTTLEKYKEMITEPAKFEVLKELVLNKIIEVEKIELNDADYEKGYSEIAAMNGQDLNAVKKQYPKDQISYHFMLLKTIESIKEKAVIKQ